MRFSILLYRNLLGRDNSDKWMRRYAALLTKGMEIGSSHQIKTQSCPIMRQQGRRGGIGYEGPEAGKSGISALEASIE